MTSEGISIPKSCDSLDYNVNGFLLTLERSYVKEYVALLNRQSLHVTSFKGVACAENLNEF